MERISDEEKIMVRKWKGAFTAATLAGDERKAQSYLACLYDWLCYRGAVCLTEKDFEELRLFIERRIKL